jgi:hypothetical protein
MKQIPLNVETELKKHEKLVVHALKIYDTYVTQFVEIEKQKHEKHVIIVHKTYEANVQ